MLKTGSVAVGVAAGDMHSCAILADGGMACWGHNDAGQLGVGNTKNVGAQAGQMGDNLQRVDLGPGEETNSLTMGKELRISMIGPKPRPTGLF